MAFGVDGIAGGDENRERLAKARPGYGSGRGRAVTRRIDAIFSHAVVNAARPSRHSSMRRRIRETDACRPAGGANDIVARTVGQKLNEMLGANIVVDNRSGAGGTIGADIAAKAPPDGYTLLMAAGAHTLAPSLYTKLPYDIVRDFAPVSISAKSTYLLVVHPSCRGVGRNSSRRARQTRRPRYAS